MGGLFLQLKTKMYWRGRVNLVKEMHSGGGQVQFELEMHSVHGGEGNDLPPP